MTNKARIHPALFGRFSIESNHYSGSTTDSLNLELPNSSKQTKHLQVEKEKQENTLPQGAERGENPQQQEGERAVYKPPCAGGFFTPVDLALQPKCPRASKAMRHAFAARQRPLAEPETGERTPKVGVQTTCFCAKNRSSWSRKITLSLSMVSVRFVR